MSCSRLGVALLALALACGRAAVEPPPAPSAIAPAAARTVADVPVEIRGNFELTATRRVGKGVEVDSAFHAWLGATELRGVAWIDEQTLRAVVPAGLSGDPLDLTVEGPTGRGLLQRAFRASPLPPPALAVTLSAPSRVEAGQPFSLQASVSNSGAPDVAGLAIVLDAPPAVSVDSSAAVDAATTVYSARATAAGWVRVSASASGGDGLTGDPLSASSTPVDVQVLGGPALRVVAHPLPAVVDVGQSFTVTADVYNDGDVDALAVSLPPAAAADIAAGTSHTFTWSTSASAAGSLQVASSGGGTDAFSGLPLAIDATWPAIAVQTPAALSAVATVAPVASVGQRVELDVDVTNSGDAAALSVAASLAPAPPVAIAQAPSAQDVPGHSTRRFVWLLDAVAAGSASLAANLAGADANSGAAATASATAPLLVQTAAALNASATGPAVVSTQQTFTISAQVANSGEAAALAVAPRAPACTGSGSLTVVGTPTATDIPGLGSASYAWTFRAASAGTVDCALGFDGADANTGAAVAASVSVHVTVQTAATLAIESFTAPALISRGQQFAVAMVVRNDGEADALGVAAPVPTVIAGGLAAAGGAAARAPITIPGGSRATLTWTFVESGTGHGTLAFSAGASGTDANSGAAVSAPAAQTATATVQEPARLVIDSFALPGSIDSGQPFTAALTVRNAGEADADNVLPAPAAPTLDATGAAMASTSSTHAAVRLSGGQATTFTWSYAENGSGTGALTLSAGASGTDANSGSAVSTAAPASGVIVVQSPASLSALLLAPALASVGQQIAVSLQVSNSGDADALSVLPAAPAVSGPGALTLVSSPAAKDVAGLGSATFTWTYTAAAAGAVSISASASGQDANSGAAVSASAGASLDVQRAASLRVDSFTMPARVDRGQQFTASMAVTNTGEAAALNVAPAGTALTATGGAAATARSTPAAVSIEGGASATFTWTFIESGTAPGTLALTAGVAGTDSNSGAAVSVAPVGAGPTIVEAAARLSVRSVTAPSALSRGQSFTVTVVVDNAGDATAQSVLPVPAPPSVAATGGAHATPSADPEPADIPGGGSASFSWTFVEDGTGSGTLTFSAGASGRDANSGATVSAASIDSGSVAVQQPARLVVTSLVLPATVSRGQSFVASVQVANTGEAAALQVLPSPMPPSASVTGGAAATASSVPAAVDIAGGDSATFTFSYTESGTGPGSIALSASADGADANSAAAVAAAASVSNTCVVQIPAALVVTALNAPTVISAGQTFTVSATIANTGEATAHTVAASPLAPAVTASGTASAQTSSTNAAVDLAGGASALLTWSYLAGNSAGSLTFSLGATATDLNSGAAVAAAAASAQTQVQSPASLSVTAFSAPAFITRGQRFTVTLTVANAGEAAALSVLPSTPAITTGGGAAAVTSSSPAAVTIAGGQSASFSWSYLENGTAAGTLQFSAGAAGNDANSGAAVVAAAASSPLVTVQQPSQLVIEDFSLPAALTRGQSFSVAMTVRNTGGTAVNGVSPSPSPPTATATGGAHATVQAPLPGAATQIAPGATATFTYHFVEDGSSSGTLTFSGAACGNDAVSGSPSCSNATSTATAAVQSAPALSVTSFTLPATLSRGQTFTATLDASNGGEAAALNVLPDPPVPSGAAHASVVSAPSATTIPGGGTARFTWTMVEDGASAGALTLTSRLTGSDANSAAAVASATASSNTATVQRPASLAISSCSAPATISRGQSFSVAMVVANPGEATATQVHPSPDPAPVTATGGAAATGATAQSPVAIAGGASATFTWTFRESGTGSGTLSFSCRAVGLDGNSSASLSAGPATAAATVQQPATLAISAFTLRSSLGQTTIDRGQDFTATMTVSNGGEASATGVAPSPAVPGLAATGGAGATTSSTVAPVTIAGGSSATFTWAYHENGTAPGTLQLSGGASGADANSAAALSAAPMASNSIAVQSPPALAVVSFAVPAKVSRGQTFTASLTIRNGGGATATSVVPDPPSLTLTGGAHATTSSTPASVTLAGSATTTFTWTYTEDGTASGTMSFSTAVHGNDSNTGAALPALTATSSTCAVQRPAALSVLSLAAPATVDRGQSFAVSMVVQNTGEATAQNVVPSPNPPVPSASGGASAALPAASAAVSIAGGSSATFTWTYAENGTAAGSLSFTAGAAGNDANTSAALTAAAASATTTVQRPASLSVTGFTLRSALGSATINRGQAFTATLTVANSGDAAANAVLPATPTIASTGGAAAGIVSGPSAATIAGGGSATFRWSYVENGTAAGTLRLSTSAAGTDANTGAAVSTAAAQSDVATVQAPASLSATASAPPLALLGQAFTVSLTVSNSGDGSVSGLAPSLSISGAGAVVTSGPTPGSASVGGSGSATFSWTCQASATGTATMTFSAAGTDVNDGSTRSAGATATTQVNEVTQVANDPFADGTTFSYIFDFNGRVYLGPNKADTGGVRMLPDGSSIENVTFTFNDDPGQKDTNTSGGPYPSLGATGCTKNTPSCGPDNEDGRGTYTSGLIAGTPWLIAAGSVSGGNLVHAYATTDTMTAPDFSYIGLKNQLGGEVQGTSAIIVFHDRIYFGFPSNKANRPFMLVVNTAPPTPGYDATSTDAVNLQSTRMPGIGVNAQTNKNTAATQLIDTFAVFNDRLYLGNNGGWMRSTTNNPGSYQATPSDWAVATPTAAAYTAKTSVTTSKLADLLPSDRALPQMAVLNGKLYAARNTTVGPQLWACAPGADLACDPGDWTLIAANTSGDTQLSQFNSANNTAITLLAATPNALYVGYDDATDGVRLYRSSNASPSTMSDFVGQGGCNASAGSASCPGLGGNGFGAGATRIFDGRALNYSGVDYLYLTAGTGSGGVRVFRVGG